MDWRPAAALFLITAAGSTSANAEEAVKLKGCPTPGAEMSCLILKGPDNITYDISAAKPAPRVGFLAIELSGTKSDKLGICQQGVILEGIRWNYTKDKCE